MDNFRLILLLAGAVLLAAIIVHALWSSRRAKGPKPPKTKMPKMAAEKKAAPMTTETTTVSQKPRDVEGFDHDGVGEVRVVARRNADVEPTFSAQMEEAPAGAVQYQSAADYDQPQAAAEAQPMQDDVILFFVVSRNDFPLSGDKLMQAFTMLNFKFGDMDIFHRHIDDAGRGAVLFSVANMIKPGTFAVDSMKQFETPGVTFFMTLPCPGNADRNLQMMLHAAKTLADEVHGMVVDAQQQPLSPQTEAKYFQIASRYSAMSNA